MIKNHNQKKKLRKRRFTLPFSIFGFGWGIMSFIFILTEIGKEKPTNWIMYGIFLPAYLDVVYILSFFSAGLGSNFTALESSVVGFFLLYVPTIFIGLFVSLLIGSIIDNLIIFLKLRE